MERYLVYDSGCSVCAGLADAAREAAGGRLEAISIRGDLATDLLDRAYPDGWAFAPYLVAVDGDRVRAWTGVASALRLARLVGPLAARRIWSAARRSGVYLPPGAKHSTEGGPTRRGFLKLAASTMGALAVVGGSPSRSHACVPCTTGTGGCGLRCTIVQTCVVRGTCSGGAQTVYCDKRVCRDGRTGEVCSTTYVNCQCLSSCG